jgi:TonB-linked SusC/RagA family outer membrane protein
MSKLNAKCIPIILMLLAVVFNANSQELLKISGNVQDSEGPLPGVNVIVSGTQFGTTTNFDGYFELDNVSSNATISFSYVGYVTQTISVNSRSTINVTLEADTNLLDEIVVIGYQSVKRSDIVGSVAIVDTDEMIKAPTGNAGAMLQGRAAGVTVTTGGGPGQGANVKIRGINSFSGQDSPLYVIDGMFSSSLSSDFNPNDIESIQVLKDAASTALYGSRGMNGVIIITTKKGKEGPLKIDYSSYYGTQTIPKKLPLTNSSRFTEINNLTYTNNGESPLNLSTGVDTNWQDAFFETGSIMEHNLRFSSGSETSSIAVSLNYFDQDGAVVGPDFDRYSIRVNSELRKGKFKFGENISLSRSNRTRLSGAPFVDLIRMLPTIPVYDETNTSGYGFGDDNNPTFGTNPIGLQNHYSNTGVTTKVFGNIYLEYELFPFLKYKLNLGLDYTQSRDKYYERIGALRLNNPDGGPAFVDDRNNEYFDILAENTLNYNQEFGKHSVSALVGVTSQKATNTFALAHTEGLAGEFWEQDNGTASPRTSGNTRVSGLQSLLGSFNYTYDDKYSVLFNIRRDGSSKFGKSNQYATFPSVSASWKLSEENFLMDNETFTYVKLRASHGTVGNQAIADYATQAVVGLNQNYVLNDQVVPGAISIQLVNPDLKWESKTTTNIGLDLELLKGKFTASADYFISNSKNLLLRIPIPLSSGNTGGDPLANVGEIENKGLELSFGYRGSKGDFRYNISANGSFLKNEVIALVEEAGNIPIFGAGQVIRTAIGDAASSFFVLRTDGIFQNQGEIDAHGVQPGASPGDVRYVDFDGNGTINNDDRQVVGNALPDFEYSFNLSASWKGFDATAYFTGVSGISIYNELNWWAGRYDDNGNYRSDVTFWTGEGTSNSAPKPIHSDSSLNPTQLSDRWVEKGDYFRLKNLQIGYSFQSNILEKLKISKLRFYFTGQNLFTITDYSGYDPEVIGNNNNGNFLNRGYDNGAFPSLRSYTLGLQIGF